MSSFDIEAWEKFKSSKEGKTAIEQNAGYHSSWDCEERFEQEFRELFPVTIFQGEEAQDIVSNSILDEFMYEEFKNQKVETWEAANTLYSSIIDSGFSVTDKNNDAVIEFPEVRQIRIFIATSIQKSKV